MSYAAWNQVTDVSSMLGAMLDAASAKFLELGSLPKHAVALDLACGDGSLTALANTMFGSRGSQMIGVDASQSMITAAQAQYPNLRFHLGDITQQLFAENSCDAAYCRFGLPFLSDQSAALASAYVMLKPGARFCVMSVADGEHNDFFNVLEVLGQPIVGHVLQWGKPEILSHHLEALGFQQVLTKKIRAQVTVADPSAYWNTVRGLFGFPPGPIPPALAARVAPGTRLSISIVYAVGTKPDPNAPAQRDVRSAEDVIAIARRNSREVSAISISQMFKGERVTFLDVRAPGTRVAQIKDSLHVTRDELEEKLPALVPDPAQVIVVYCDLGNQSALATNQLRAMGYVNVWSLQRGLAGWEYVGGKTVPV